MISEKFTCTILDFPLKVEVSKKRKVKYWKFGEKIPKKYANYTYDGDYLVDPAGNKVVKNVKTAGTPKFIGLNFQQIYVGVHHSTRTKIVGALHTLFHDAFKTQLPAHIDLTGKRLLISLHFYDTLTNKTRDLDNLSALFFKCGIDCLTKPNNPNQVNSDGYSHKLSIIEDDTISFIPYIALEFTPILEGEQRKLDFNLYVVDPAFRLESMLDSQIGVKLVPL